MEMALSEASYDFIKILVQRWGCFLMCMLAREYTNTHNLNALYHFVREIIFISVSDTKPWTLQFLGKYLSNELTYLFHTLVFFTFFFVETDASAYLIYYFQMKSSCPYLFYISRFIICIK